MSCTIRFMVGTLRKLRSEALQRARQFPHRKRAQSNATRSKIVLKVFDFRRRSCSGLTLWT